MHKVTGADKLMRKLAQMAPNARAKIAAALDAGAAEIVATQKRLAPKKSGALQRSIKAVKGPYKAANANVRGVGSASAEAGITIVAGDATAYYAAWVEFGTSPHSIFPSRDDKSLKIAGEILPPGQGVKHPGAKKHPFFYPGYRMVKKRVKSRVARAVKAAAREVAGQ